MQRACAAALLRKGESIIENPGHSNDDKTAIGIIKVLGAKLNRKGNEFRITSPGISPAKNPGKKKIDCGESGLSIRMFTPIAALSNEEITITGSGSLAGRPLDLFDEILPQLGAEVKLNDGKLPLVIQGPLKPKNIEIDGSLSSQFLTGLLMVYGAAPNPSKGGAPVSDSSMFSIKVRDLKSKPYIDLTLDVMKQFGLNVPENKNYEEFIFTKSASLIPTSGGEGGAYTVEGDWSGGAFLLVAGVIAGNITVRGLNLSSTQADKKITEALMSANAGIAMDAKGIQLHKTAMQGFEFDAT